MASAAAVSMADVIRDYLRGHAAALDLPPEAITTEKLSHESKMRLRDLFFDAPSGGHMVYSRIKKAISIYVPTRRRYGPYRTSEEQLIALACYGPYTNIRQTDALAQATIPLLADQQIGGYFVRWRAQHAAREDRGFEPAEYYSLIEYTAYGLRGDD